MPNADDFPTLADPIRVKRGNPVAKALQFVSQIDGSPIPLDSYGDVWRADIRQTPNGSILAQWAIDQFDVPNGVIHLILHSAATELLDVGSYGWDIRVSSSAEPERDPVIRLAGSILVLEAWTHD